MDNASRTERTRGLVLQAALTIIARDGAARLTLDAIAKESGVSKGGLLHQFPNKQAVLTALLDHQTAFFETFSRDFLAGPGAACRQPVLAAQIATLREVLKEPNYAAFATLAAFSREPAFLETVRAQETRTLEAIRAEAADPEKAVHLWLAARGLAFSALLGLCPMSSGEREQVFEKLLHDACGEAAGAGDPPVPAQVPQKVRRTSSPGSGGSA